MKKVAFLIFLFLVSFVYSNPITAVEFRDDVFNININYNEGVWESIPGEKYRDRLTLRHLSVPATINVLAYRFNETITANGLVQKRIQSVYDGWQLLNQQSISKLQSRKKMPQRAFDPSIENLFGRCFKEQQQIAGDICFVMDDTLGVVLNISVDQPDTLLEVKSEFNKIYNSIWFGTEKPRINFVVNNSDEWVMDHQNLSRKRFYNANFLLKNDTGISNKIELAKDVSRTGVKTYTNANGDYILNGNALYVIHPVSYKVKKLVLNLINPELVLHQNGFYAIQKAPLFRVEKYSNDFNQVDSFDSFEPVVDALMVNDTMLIIEPEKIKLLKGNAIEWQINHAFDVHAMVAHEDRLIIADNQDATLHMLDFNTGELLGSLKMASGNLSESFVDIAMNQSKLLVFTTQSDDTISKKIIDINIFAIEDETSTKYMDFEVASITSDFIIIQYKNEDNDTILEALDGNTFASVWTLPFNQYHHTVVSSQQVLSIDNNQNLVSFELTTPQESKKINLGQLMNQHHVTENVSDVSVLALMPLKNKLLTIIEQESTHKAVYLR